MTQRLAVSDPESLGFQVYQTVDGWATAGEIPANAVANLQLTVLSYLDVEFLTSLEAAWNAANPVGNLIFPARSKYDHLLSVDEPSEAEQLKKPPIDKIHLATAFLDNLLGIISNYDGKTNPRIAACAAKLDAMLPQVFPKLKYPYCDAGDEIFDDGDIPQSEW